MDNENIKALAEIIAEYDLSAIEVCEGETKIRLEKTAPAGAAGGTLAIAAGLPVGLTATATPSAATGYSEGGAAAGNAGVGGSGGGAGAKTALTNDGTAGAGANGSWAGAEAGDVLSPHETDANSAEAAQAIDFNRLTEVTSPLVGVFYSSPSPEAEPFVSIGTKVTRGTVLCLIETMKLMNEIVAEADGEIVDICVKNGDIAEFGQVLFKMF